MYAEIICKLAHIDLTHPEAPKKILAETWRIRVYAVASQFVADLHSRQRNITQQPLHMHQFAYGGLMIRGSDAWLKSAKMLTSEGKNTADGNHTRPVWVDLGGPLGETAAGITVMGHPTNFRFPQPVRLHPHEPYFCLAPMVLGKFNIQPNEVYESRFRFLIHDGAIQASIANDNWHHYSQPPVAKVQ